MIPEEAPLGAAWREESGCHVLVWAPFAKQVEVVLEAGPARPVLLQAGERGYHHGRLAVRPGDLYRLRLDGGPLRPDPASRYQPLGVHGPSEIVAPAFGWTDGSWRGIALERLVFYELHVGTFTREGTFDAIVPHLAHLADLGVTAVELMPVAEFPGRRNWGYDGVAPFAVQSSYGGPQGLKRLVDACHGAGLAAVLDVVYNHLGPEGNYLREFGPYFTDRYRTPWGQAFNLDGPGSDEVRRFFLENARRWIAEFHFDGLRLDAVHAIRDHSARPFLAELTGELHALGERIGRTVHVVAESDDNDSRLVRRVSEGGFGMDAVWSDDFHHSLHALVTGERAGYYRDFGAVEDLAAAFREPFVYRGQFSAYRGRRHGNSARGVSSKRFVVSAQNHDQVGNRGHGERLSSLVDFEALKVAAAAVLHSPYLPLLFMGEEYGEVAPFLYFVSHGDPDLVESVRRGRREEFAAFGWTGDPPDPQAESTFTASKLDWALAASGRHARLLAYCGELLRLRREAPALAGCEAAEVEARPFPEERALVVLRRGPSGCSALLLAFAPRPCTLPVPVPRPLRKVLDSAEERWGGTGRLAPLCIDGAASAPLLLTGPAALLYERAS
jgi:maltooligosyltrehalose trehalohydrolase